MKLDDRLRQVLAMIGDRFTMEDVIGASGATAGKASLSCAHLEIKGLATKTMTGYRLTRLGRRRHPFWADLAGMRHPAEKSADRANERTF